jgi:hypothetical protein
MNEMEQHELAMHSSIQNNLAFTPGSTTKQSIYARTRNNQHTEELHHYMKFLGWQKRERLVGMGRSDQWKASRRGGWRSPAEAAGGWLAAAASRWTAAVGRWVAAWGGQRRWAVAVRIGSRWPVGVVRAPLVLAKSENLACVL